MTDSVDQKLLRLHEQIRRCRRCRLWKSRTHAVPGEGPADARIMFVGEAPGENEDLLGRPFVGRSGQYFDYVLEHIRLPRESVFVTGSVKCRPPGNRRPKPDELETCKENWLSRQIEWINPRIIVTLGAVALKQVVGACGQMGEIHGRSWECDGRTILATVHPAWGMRFGRTERVMEKDFELLAELVTESGRNDE